MKPQFEGSTVFNDDEFMAPDCRPVSPAVHPEDDVGEAAAAAAQSEPPNL